MLAANASCSASFAHLNKSISVSNLPPFKNTFVSLFSLDEANKVFVEECLQEAQVNGTILPLPVQPLVKEMNKDLTLFNQLDQAESIFNGWMIRIKDTKRLTAHEAYKVALTVYTIYEALAKAGVPGAQASYDRLKQRFAGQGGRPPQQNP